MTTYTYDDSGDMVSQTDPLGRVTEYGYNDGQRFATAQVNWDGCGDNAVTTMVYDDSGQLLGQIDPLGRVTRYGYDDLGRQTAVIQPDPSGSGSGSG